VDGLTGLDGTTRPDGASAPVPRARVAPSTQATVAPSILDFSDRPPRRKPRSTPLEWIALALAVILPPAGLVLSIVARAVAWHRDHWVTRVTKAATAVSILFTILFAGGAVAYTVVAGAAASEADVLARAQPLCDAIAESPGVLDTPGFGWPTEVAPLPATLDAMRQYQDRWAELAAVAPASASAAVTAIADQAQILVDAVEASQAIDRPGNLATMRGLTDASALAGWVAEYCG
jgi:hypothetical protein